MLFLPRQSKCFLSCRETQRLGHTGIGSVSDYRPSTERASLLEPTSNDRETSLKVFPASLTPEKPAEEAESVHSAAKGFCSLAALGP